MSKRTGYQIFTVGLVTGVLVSAIFAALMVRQRDSCEPVVDVEYKRVGKDYVPETVVRHPVRDGERCLLAEVGS